MWKGRFTSLKIFFWRGLQVTVFWMRHSFNIWCSYFSLWRKSTFIQTFVILFQIVFFSGNSIRVLLLISVENHSHWYRSIKTRTNTVVTFIIIFDDLSNIDKSEKNVFWWLLVQLAQLFYFHLLFLDHYKFPGNCPPTTPLSQHFALREK